MGTSPIVDLERIGRLAAALDESARACARLAPAWSADLFWLLGFVQGQVAATLAPPVPAPPAAPVPPAPSAPARALP